MALSKRVSVAVTPEEYRALQWVALQDLQQRHPHYSKRTKRPGRGAVLRKMSVEEALRRYNERETRGDDSSAGLLSGAKAEGHRRE